MLALRMEPIKLRLLNQIQTVAYSTAKCSRQAGEEFEPRVSGRWTPTVGVYVEGYPWFTAINKYNEAEPILITLKWLHETGEVSRLL